MFDEIKLNAIRECLKIEFNTIEITDKYEFDREAQTFTITEPGRICLVTIAGEFIDDNDASEISNILKRHKLKSSFRNEKARRLVFKDIGNITVEY